MKRFRLKPNCALAQKSVGKKLLKRVSSDELSIQQYRSTCTQHTGKPRFNGVYPMLANDKCLNTNRNTNTETKSQLVEYIKR